jgi:hypothetical protein
MQNRHVAHANKLCYVKKKNAAVDMSHVQVGYQPAYIKRAMQVRSMQTDESRDVGRWPPVYKFLPDY